MAKTVLPRNSIRTRIVLTTLAFFVASLWALSFYATHQLRNDTVELVGKQQLSTVTYIADQIDYELTSRIEALQKVADTITPEMIANPERLQYLLHTRIELLKLFNNGTSAFDQHGTLVALEPFAKERLNANYMDREHLIGALQQGKATISSPFMGRLIQAPIIAIAVPIRSAQGEIVGALAGLIDINQANFLGRVTENTYGMTGGYYLADNLARRIITATNKARVMELLPPQGTFPLIDSLVQDFEGTKIGMMPNGVEFLVSTKMVPHTRWSVAASLPTREAFAPIREMQENVLLASLLLTLLVGSIQLFVLRKQLSPLRHTADALAHMAEKTAPLLPIAIHRHDEIGQVVDSFNRLLQTLETKEKALRESEQNLRVIFENSGDAIFLSWHQETIDLANPAACTMFGYSEEEMQRHSLLTLADPTDERLPEAIKRAQETGRFYGELRCIAHGGRVLTAEIHTTTYRDDDGRMMTINLLRNVSERKLIEAELEQHRHHLAELVAERTRELVKARDAAEAANRAKSAFLANMSHEIRTPMNVILGMVTILRRGGVTPQQAERLSKIDTATAHLLGIINNILDLSKIEAGKFIVEETPVSPTEILQTTRLILEERAQAKGIEIEVVCDDLPTDLYGDPTRLQQALINYATNAVKFSKTGKITLRAMRQEEDTASLLVRFEVQDSGIGISPAILPRLFEAFEQADNSTTRKYGGTGLGLAITRRLAELMGGSVGAQSMPGVGSTFWFTARLTRKTSDEAGQSAAAIDTAGLAISQRYAGRRVLIVDDDPMNLEVARFLLEEVGLVVDCAADGLLALQALREEDYDIILMDVQMPTMDGLEATQLIRQTAAYSTIPILAMTANAFTEDRERCLAAGMDDVVIKPFDPDSLSAILLRWLEHRRS